MKSITVTTYAAGGLEIQDPFPSEGRLSVHIAPSTTKTFTTTTGQYNRIRSQLDAALAGGLLTTLLVNETEEERSDKFLELKKAANPTLRTGFGKFFVATADGKPYFMTELGAILNLGMTGSDPLVFKGAIALATSFPLLADVKTGWLYRVTADVTDSGGGGRTGTGQVFLAGAEIAWNGTNWSEIGPALTSPIQYLGTIANAAAFPTPTAVRTGHMYLIAAPVVDNDGTKTNTGLVFTTADTIIWNGASWNVMTAQNTMAIRGVVAAAADFPTAALVRVGHVYRATADVTDNDPTKTNTAQVFRSGDQLFWNGATWTIFGRTARTLQMHEIQAVAADATTVAFVAPAAGRILAVNAYSTVGAGVGESETVDVRIAGVSALTAPIDLNQAAGTAVQAGVIDAAHDDFIAAQIVTLVRDYTAGAPSPMSNILVDVLYELTI